MKMIETQNLAKRFEETVAVDRINLEVEERSIHGFVGPNGAGKTTTMRMLVGTLNPTEGEAYIKGEKAGSISAKELIGYSPQNPQFYDSMNALDYLEYMGEMSGMGSETREKAKELLQWLELEGMEDKKIGDYSGGMKRKLSLAQAMIHEPQLLILDEPTAGLDPEGRMSIINSLEELTTEGMTVFVSSHVLAELEKFIDTVTILRDGELVTTRPLDKLAGTYSSEAFVVSTPSNDELMGILEEEAFIDEVWKEDDKELRILTDEPDEFKLRLVNLLAENEIRLDSFKQEGGLEEAFIKAIEGSRREDAD